MSQLLHNIDGIICAFNKYAKKDSDCCTLSKGELKQLIQKEFAQVIVDPHDPQTVETVLRLLDTDCDGKVDFEEFAVLVFKVAKACYKEVQECQSKAEGVPKQGETSMQQQEVQAPQVPTQPPVQELQAPKKVPDADDLPQDLKQEAPRLEIYCGKVDEHVPMQEEDPADQTPEAPRIQSIQTAIEELVKVNPTCQPSEQDKAQVSQQEPQSAGAPRRVCIQEPLTPDQEQSHGGPCSMAQEASQQHQVEEPCNPDQQKVTSPTQTQERPSQESTLEPKQVTEEPLQTSSGCGNQQTHVEQPRATTSPICSVQEEQTSQKFQERLSPVEQRPALQSELQHELEEHPTCQQEHQTQGQSLASAMGQQERLADSPSRWQRTGVLCPGLGQRQNQSSRQGPLLRDQITPHVAEPAKATSVQGPQDPSARLPFQTPRSRLHCPSPWAPKQ